MPGQNFIVRGDDGDDYGPVDLAELRQWVRENRAGLGTTVRLDEPGALWQPWQYYPELVALLAEKQATTVYQGVVLAPIGRRAAAFAIDLVLLFPLLVLVLTVVLVIFMPDVLAQLMVARLQPDWDGPQLAPLSDLLLKLLVYGMVTLYMAGFTFAHGKTPGKALMRLRVVDPSGGNPDAARALVRGIILSFSICLFFFPLLYVFIHPQRRALHDLIAGTCVVEE